MRLRKLRYCNIRVTSMWRLSVHPFVPYGLVTRKQSNAKNQVGIDVLFPTARVSGQ